MAENFRGVNIDQPQIDGKVDAHKLVDGLDSLSHTEEQVVAMRRLMQLCDPSPDMKLAVMNCKAVVAAGVLPVLVRLLRCGVHQLVWGSVLCLGSIAAFVANAGTVVPLHPPSHFSRRFNKPGEGASAE